MSAATVNPPAATEAILRWAAERHLPDAHLGRWLGLAQPDRAALLELASALRLRTGQFVSIFELLEEIALREHEAIAVILARREIRQLVDGKGSAPGRARQLSATLRAIRFPRLKRVSDRMAAAIAALRLPGGVKVHLSKELCSDEVTVEISARGAAELKRLIDAVAQMSPGLARIADLAAGIDSLDDEV